MEGAKKGIFSSKTTVLTVIEHEILLKTFASLHLGGLALRKLFPSGAFYKNAIRISAEYNKNRA